MEHGTWNIRNWVILYQFRTNVLICVIFACDNSVCLMFFSPHSPAVSVRTQAAHWLPLALLGGEKNNAEENRRLTKKYNKSEQRSIISNHA